MVTFENRDCMDAMREFPDKYFDLAVVDPPYGINVFRVDNTSRSKLANSKGYKAYAGNDLSAPSKEYFKELKRISKNQIVFGANHFIDNVCNGWAHGASSPCWIVWDKENGQNDFADCELALTSFPTATRIFRFRWQGMLQGDMKNKEVRIHPTQKPVALYKWILRNYAKPGDKILDTHVGSGSSLIACYDLGFDVWGYEIDKEYYSLAKKRIDEFSAQIRMDI